MSASPTVHPAPDPTVSPHTQSASSPNANSALNSSNAQLAALLSDAFRELEGLRRECSATKRRAEKAEHLLRGFQASADAHTPNAAQAQIDDANRLMAAFEERAQRSEIAAEESEARRRVLLESWKQLEQYLIVVELRAADARAGYSRIISEGGGQLTLASIPASLGAGIGGGIQQIHMPPPPSRPGHTSRRSRDQAPTFAALPPPPNPNPAAGSRRHRTPSLDSYAGYPPSKRVRGDSDDRGREIRPTHSESHVHAMQQQLADRDYQFQMQQHMHMQNARLAASGPRMILSATDRKRKRGPNSRSSSRNSNSSYDVEEELIRASGGDEQHLQQNGSIHLGNGNSSFSAPSSPHPENHQTLAVPRFRSSKRREDSRPRSSNSMHSVPSHSTGYPVSMNHPIRESPPYPSGTPTRNSRGSASTATADAGPLAQPGQVQTYQTHVFAPVVTGAPTKKPKFPGAAGVALGGQTGPAQSAGQGSPGGPADAPATVAPAPQIFPAQNAQGQRICRQCGLVGRYKDGKCVEKWGPGPMGPGTVCDRCRKKMKRVERRGTLENQQLANSGSIGGVTSRASHAQLSAQASQLQHSQGPQSSQGSIQRSDTMPVHSTSRRGFDREESSITTNPSSLRTAANSNKGSSTRPSAAARGPPSSPPVIASLTQHDEDVPTSNVGRGAAAAAAARLEPGSRSQSRPSSRNNDRNTQAKTPTARSSRPTPPATIEPGTNGNGPKKSPLSHVAGAGSASPIAHPMEVDETDADADADAEAEAEIVDAVEFDGEHDGEGEEDAEAELLEAVDAAEANSNSSQVA